ncbi:MAG: type I pullulanase [Clostridia bacterium]|nr:type I pullulanase [Clostridia bacterium]
MKNIRRTVALLLVIAVVFSLFTGISPTAQAVYAASANTTEYSATKMPLNVSDFGKTDIIKAAAESLDEKSSTGVQTAYGEAYTESYGGLSVVSTVPADKAANIAVDIGKINIEFNDEITVQNEAINIQDSSNNSLDGITYNAVGSNLSIDLNTNLAYGTGYTVNIPAGSIKGASGIVNEDIKFSFTTILNQKTRFIVHYYRFDGNYSGWDLWLWQPGQNGSAYAFNKGLVDVWQTAEYEFSGDISSLNFIIRRSDWSDRETGGTRSISVSNGVGEVWIVQGVERVYTQYSPEIIKPNIRAAIADSDTRINLNLASVAQGIDYSKFAVYDGANKLAGTSVKGSNDSSVVITLSEPIKDVTKIYTVKDESGLYVPTSVMLRRILDKYVYNGNDLGLTYSSVNSIFKVWAPTAVKVSLALYDNAGIYNESGVVTDHTGGQETLMQKDSESGVWQTTISGDLKGKYYMYKVEFADGTANYARDPYAKAVTANGQRTAIVDLAATNPGVWNPSAKPAFVSPTDAVIYEVHVRDISMDSSSGIVNKGKFKGLTETGTTGPNGVKTGIDHIAEMGITHVHLLPVYDFGQVNELRVDDPDYTGRKYNWGYDPENYNVPEGSYSLNPSDPGLRIKEFKEVVQALHNKGLRVVMDVVYNHTDSIVDGPFNKIVPGYYYRTFDNGNYSDGSGVGNEIAAERPMVKKFIIDSVKYWATEYGVDGFRFDLLALMGTETSRELVNELKQKIDPTLLIYGEPWAPGSTPFPGGSQVLKGAQRGEAYAVFNDNLRGAIKGDSDGAGRGFATGQPGTEGGIVRGIDGALNDFTNNPTETINYVTAHDNLALWDKVIRTQGLGEQEGFIDIERGILLGEDLAEYGTDIERAIAEKTTPHAAIDKTNVLANETVKRGLLANGIVMTSQGIAFLHSGEEFLRTRFGERDGFRGPDAIDKFRWQWKADFKPVFDYYKGLIELRKSHPAFRMTNGEEVRNKMQVFKQNENVVAFQLKDFANNDPWKNIVVIYNADTSAKQVTLPIDTTWNVVVDHTAAGVNTIRTVNGSTITVEGLSMMVLYDQAEAPYTPVVTSIELTPSTMGLPAGDIATISAVVKDQKGRPMVSEPVIWSSSNTGVATVNASGKVTTIADGQAVITAAVGGKTASVTVNVANLVPTAIELSGQDNVFENRNILLSAVVRDQFGQIMTKQAVTWTSSDSSIATVDPTGRVDGVKAGIATITASVGGVKATRQVTVRRAIQRFVLMKYVRPDKDYTNWDIWVWNTGMDNGGMSVPFAVKDGIAAAQIQVAPEVSSFGFIVRKNDWSSRESGNRFINVAPNEVYTKVTVISGQDEMVIVPDAPSPVVENDVVTFSYRDNELFKNDALSTLGDVQVEIDGKNHAMTYDSQKDAYICTIQEVLPGIHGYRFIVPGKEALILDPKNNRTIMVNGIECSAVEVIKPISSDATLKNIKVNGAAVKGFDPSRLEYLVQWKNGKKHVPQVTAEAADSNAKIVIKPAEIVPGTTTITVTAEDGVTVKTYKINFTKDDVSDTTLKAILIDGKHLPKLNPNVTNYAVYLPKGSATVPEVTAVAKDEKAKIVVTPAEGIPGTTIIEVAAVDGVTTTQYEISFKIENK